MALGDYVDKLVSIGFYDIALPFLLVFVIVYALLQQLKILGDKAGLNAVAAMAIAAFVTYFARVFELGKWMSFFLGKSAMAILILIVLLMLATFLYRTLKNNEMVPAGKETVYLVGIFALISAVVWLMLKSSPGTFEMMFGKDITVGSDIVMGVVIIAGLLAFMAWAVGG